MAATEELQPRRLATIAIGLPAGGHRTLPEVGIHDVVLAGSDKDRGTQVSLVLNLEKSGWHPLPRKRVGVMAPLHRHGLKQPAVGVPGSLKI